MLYIIYRQFEVQLIPLYNSIKINLGEVKRHYMSDIKNYRLLYNEEDGSID